MSEPDQIEILLVAHDADELEMTLRALRQMNLANKVQIARDGVEALDFIFRRGPHAARKTWQRPRLILLDLKLPRVDGLGVLRQIKGDPSARAIPVVMLTSSQEQNDMVASYNLGLNSYIVKPVSFAQFAEAVQKLELYWLLLNQLPAANP